VPTLQEPAIGDPIGRPLKFFARSAFRDANHLNHPNELDRPVLLLQYGRYAINSHTAQRVFRKNFSQDWTVQSA
jgi:hypothetical protein